MNMQVSAKRVSTILFLCLFVAAFTFLYWSALKEFVYDWSHDDNYSHGFLIPLISVFILWQKRERLKNTKCEVNLLGFFVLVCGLALAILGTASAEWYMLRFSIIVVLSGVVLYLLGMNSYKEVWFPIAFLIFAIPLPYVLFRSLTFPLQLFSTKVTYGIISWLGVSALREGNLILLPNYTLEVVDACSGLRSLITLSGLAALFAYYSGEKPHLKIIIFLIAIPVALTANIFRLIVTVLGALLISTDFADGFIHEFSGVFVFFIGLCTFFVIVRLLKWMVAKKNIGLSSV